MKPKDFVDYISQKYPTLFKKIGKKQLRILSKNLDYEQMSDSADFLEIVAAMWNVSVVYNRSNTAGKVWSVKIKR